MSRPLVTAKDLEALRGAPPEGAMLTPLARDAMRRRGLSPDLVRAPDDGRARRLVIANWKSHKTLVEAATWAEELRRLGGPQDVTAVVCPPFTGLAALATPLAGVALLGAQDVSPHGEGAFTGEVAARHLVDVGCRFALVGHSERRAAGETDALARAKVRAALGCGDAGTRGAMVALDPVLCVGETKDERRASRADSVVATQLRAALDGLDPTQVARVVVAYEPRWAIGQGVTPTDEEIVAMLGQVRAVIARGAGAAAAAVSVLYGGSVTKDNAARILALPGCQGALVGGASLQAATFGAIWSAARRPAAGRA